MLHTAAHPPRRENHHPATNSRAQVHRGLVLTLNTSSYNPIFPGEHWAVAAVCEQASPALANGLLSNLTVAVTSCKFHSCVHFLGLTSKHLCRAQSSEA